MMNKILKNIAILSVLALPLACTRATEIASGPQLSSPKATEEFAAMTAPEIDFSNIGGPEQRASLWAGSSRSLVGDRRAAARGDILTVVIQIDDRAEMSNTSGRSRTAADRVAMPQLAGIPQRLNPKLPDGASMGDLVSLNSSSSFKGQGNISRRDRLTVRVAATVIDTLPNGVLHIQGKQEVVVNNELREMTVTGFVRPSDIGRRNEIAYDRIAGARISYGGRGQISDVQKPRYGQEIVDMIMPY